MIGTYTTSELMSATEWSLLSIRIARQAPDLGLSSRTSGAAVRLAPVPASWVGCRSPRRLCGDVALLPCLYGLANQQFGPSPSGSVPTGPTSVIGRPWTRLIRLTLPFLSRWLREYLYETLRACKQLTYTNAQISTGVDVIRCSW
jgi:hypothetical protein